MGVRKVPYIVALIAYAYIFMFYAAVVLAPLILLVWLVPPLKVLAIVLGIGVCLLAVLRAHLASVLYSLGSEGFFDALGESGTLLKAIIRDKIPWIRAGKSSQGSDEGESDAPREEIYLVQLSGWNFLLNLDEGPRKCTFYVNRYVRATSGPEAKQRAHSLLTAELHDVFEVLNSEDDPGITNALHVSDPVVMDDSITELPKMEYFVTDDVGSACPVLDEAQREELQSRVQLGKAIIMEAIVWDFNWPKDEPGPATRQALERAREHFLAALDIDEASYPAKYYLAMIAVEMNELEEASSFFEEAAEILPQDPDCPRFTGLIADLLDEPQKAVRCLERAVRRHPLGASFWQNLAMAYRRAGRLPDARRSAERALGLDPGCLDCRRTLELIADSEREADASPSGPLDGL